jgi:peptidoglycan/LPS O-acetylase OafA/YrhL
MSMSGIGAGIWLSSQAESSTPVHRTSQQHSTTQTPQGWLVPSDVVRLTEPPPQDEAAIFDRRRLIWVLSAVVLAGCAVAMPLVFQNNVDRSTEGYVFGMAFVWLALSLGCLCSTIHNLRQGEPRPLLDRPAVLIVFLGVQSLLLLLVFVMALPGAVWTIGAWLGLLLLAGSFVATALWLVATGERWSLSYARRSP